MTNASCSRALLLVLACLVGAARTAPAQGNPRFLNPSAMPAARGYSHVVEIPAGSRLVYISGQVALDSTGALVGAGDFRAQAEQVFTNLHHALAAVGATFADVVKLNYYVRDALHVAELREVRDRHINLKAPPTSILLEVPHLFRDDLLLEIEAVAVVPGS